MKIAVTHENGQIFSHFGKAEEFKIYTVEDGKVVSSEIIKAEGTGHDANADLLAKNNVTVLICGGLGDAALEALEAVEITVVFGQEGDADKAVEAYLDEEIMSNGSPCSHDDGGCSGSCGSCGGCGGHKAPLFEGPNAGKTVQVHYRGTFNDGSQFDSSYDRGEPLEFVCGAGMMIKGFDKAVVDMQVGEKKSIHLMPAEAYGESDPSAIFTLTISDLPGAEELVKGDKAYLSDMYGRPVPVKVIERTETEITFDANHEMAGKELNFDIELVSIK